MNNTQVYSYATSLAGPWSEWTEFADDGANTYHSQTSFILPFGDSAIYMGDRWQPSNLMRSTYVWLPLVLSGETDIWLTNRVNWIPNVADETWDVGPTESRYEGEDGDFNNGAEAVTCSGCSGSLAAGFIGGPSGGSVNFEGISSEADGRTTIRMRYANGDSSERHATVTVNGDAQEVAFLPTGDGQTTGSSVVHVDLQSGAGNTLSITTSGGDYGPDLDIAFVPIS